MEWWEGGRRSHDCHTMRLTRLLRFSYLSGSKCRCGIHGSQFSALESLMSKQPPQAQFLALAKQIPLLLSEEAPSGLKKKCLRENNVGFVMRDQKIPRRLLEFQHLWPAHTAQFFCTGASGTCGFFTSTAESHDHSSKVRLQSGNLGLLLSLSTEHYNGKRGGFPQCSELQWNPEQIKPRSLDTTGPLPLSGSSVAHFTLFRIAAKALTI